MARFYQILEEHPDYNKAEALRLAQFSLWDNSARDGQIPAFWGAYVLVGNWQ
jgi:CHAT domain-containing protein